MEIDPTTGLPVEAIQFEDLAKSSQTITLTTEKRRFGKVSTIIKGFDNGVDIKDISKSLKSKLACGGTAKKGIIELQGNHKGAVRPILNELGFTDDQIVEG